MAFLGGLAIVQLIGVHRHQAARRRAVAGAAVAEGLGAREDDADGEGVVRVGGIGVAEEARLQGLEAVEGPFAPEEPRGAAPTRESGTETCRERECVSVYIPGVAASIKNNNTKSKKVCIMAK